MYMCIYVYAFIYIALKAVLEASKKNVYCGGTVLIYI